MCLHFASSSVQQEVTWLYEESVTTSTGPAKCKKAQENKLRAATNYEKYKNVHKDYSDYVCNAVPTKMSLGFL